MIKTYNCPYCYSSNIQAMCKVDGFTTFKCRNCFKSFSKNTGTKQVYQHKHNIEKCRNTTAEKAVLNRETLKNKDSVKRTEILRFRDTRPQQYKRRK